MAPFSRLFKRGGRTGSKVIPKPVNATIVSTAYRTETPRPTTPQSRLPRRSGSTSRDNNASNHHAIARTPSNHSSPQSTTSLAEDTNDIEALIICTIQTGNAESLEPILAARGNEIYLTEAIVRAAKERYCGDDIVKLLMQHVKKQQDESRAEGESKAQAGPAALLAVLELFGIETGMLVVLDFWSQVEVELPIPSVLKILSESEQALQIMEIILRERSRVSDSKFVFTEEWMISAAKNDAHGTELMNLLLCEARSTDDLSITESVLEAAAGNTHCAIAIFNVLLDESRDGLVVTPRVVLAASHNPKLAEALTVLLPKLIEGKNFTVDEKMVEAMMDDDSLEPWQRQLRLEFSKGRTSENMMKQAVKNMISGSKHLVFTGKALLALAALEDTTVLECLLSEPGLRDRIKISPSMVKVAATLRSGLKAMEIMLRERGNEIQIDEGVILAALSNTWYGQGLAMIELIFRIRPGETRITERVIEIAADGEPELLSFLLKHVGDDFLVTTKMVENVVLKDSGDEKALVVLLKAGKHDIQVSAKLFKGAYNRSVYDYSHQRNLKMLLEDGHDLRISRKAALAFRKRSDMKMMALLLQKLGHDEHIREAVLIAAIENIFHSEEMLVLILAQSWEVVTITERVVLAANKDRTDVKKLEKLLEMLLEIYCEAVHIVDKAVLLIMQLCGTKTAQLLLQKLGCSLRMSSKLLESVAKNHQGCDVLKLLLRERGTEIRITQGIIDAAISNKKKGGAIILLLLMEKRGEIQITQSLVVYAAGASQELWKWLIQDSGQNIQITERVLEEGVSHHWRGSEMLRDLLGVYGDDIQITERVLEAAAKNARNGIKILESLFLERENQICITERIMEAAAQNTKKGIEILELLLKERPDEAEVTERVLEAVASNEDIGDEIMDHTLGKYGDDIAISERVLERVCSNEKKGRKISTIILQKSSHSFILTERVLEAAAQMGWEGACTVRNLLAKDGSVVQMTSKVLETAAKSEYGGSMVIDLLERCSDRVQLTESVMEVCARNDTTMLTSHTRSDIVMEFVRKRFQDIQLTDRVVEFLVARTWPHMAGEVLDEIGDKIQITQGILEESAASYDSSQAETVGRLLRMTRGQIRVSKCMVEAAVENENCGPKIIKLLLEERGEEFKITERIIIKAAKNERGGTRIIDTLLQERGDSGEIQINERLMEAAAGNIKSGKEIIDLLLQASGDRFQLTDAIAEIAAKNSGCGERIIELFRIRTRERR